MEKSKKEIMKKLAGGDDGYISTKDLKREGLNVYDINVLLEKGEIERVKWGLYRWTETQNEYHEMEEVSRLVPQGVLCLFSALAWHELTTYIPKVSAIAIPIKARKPVLPKYPPIKIYYFSDVRFETGIEIIHINGHPVKIYDLEKTVCDIILYRNKIGMDIVKEVMENYVGKRGKNVQRLMQYAEALRVLAILKTYLEVLI